MINSVVNHRTHMFVSFITHSTKIIDIKDVND